MANDLNQCNFIGRLGADPEVRYLPSGDAVANFRIAVGWKSKEKEGTEWVSIVAFGKLGEICGDYLKKGAQVFVSCRVKTEEYEKNGEKRYSTRFVADQMQMLGSRGDGAGPAPSSRHVAAPAPRPSAGSGVTGFNDFEDDMPFVSCSPHFDTEPRLFRRVSRRV